jgi:Domain of unknown function (DUF4384)
MKRLPLILFGLVICILSFGLLGDISSVWAGQGSADSKGEVSFQWAFAAIREGTASPEYELITRDLTLKSGDQIKFFLNPMGQCHAYLIYQSSNKDISVLYPYRFNDGTNEAQTSGGHYIPAGNQWFELDHRAGEEKFYLLVAAQRLNDLEVLSNQYESADSTKKGELYEEIVSEIKKLRKQHFKFKTFAEKPAAIIGNMRGVDDSTAVSATDLASYATEISADTFFSRTFTIDHQ